MTRTSCGTFSVHSSSLALWLHLAARQHPQAPTTSTAHSDVTTCEPDLCQQAPV